MTVPLRWAVILLVLSLGSCSMPPSQQLVNMLKPLGSRQLDSSRAAIFYNYMQHFPNGSECSIALIEGGSTIFGGVARRNDTVSWIDNSGRAFEIGSVTKTITATILAKLAYEGRVDLEAPIKTFLPITLNQSSLNGKEVTLLHLANHTSGFPKEPDNIFTDYTIPGGPYRIYDTTKLYDFVSKRLTLVSIPGEIRSYSNLGGGLLGHLLTLLTNRSYEELLIEHINTPLGLKSTFVKIDSGNQSILVQGRDPKGRIVQNWELNSLVGGGGVKSTARDMAKYLRAHLTDTTYFLLTQRPTFEYADHNTAGLGWTWYNHEDTKFVSATGGTGGYSCCVIFERTTQTGIVVLTNVSAFLASKGDYITKLSRELYDPLVAKVLRDSVSVGRHQLR